MAPAIVQSQDEAWVCPAALDMIVLVTTVPPLVAVFVEKLTVVGGGTGVDEAWFPPLAYATVAPLPAACDM